MFSLSCKRGVEDVCPPPRFFVFAASLSVFLALKNILFFLGFCHLFTFKSLILSTNGTFEESVVSTLL